MFSKISRQSLALALALFCAISSSFAGPKVNTLCDFGQCLSLEKKDVLRLQNGETVLVAQNDPNSSFEVVYVYQLLSGEVSPPEAADYLE